MRQIVESLFLVVVCGAPVKLLHYLTIHSSYSRAETVEDDDEYADELDEAAFLVVRRKLSVERPQVGKEITVLIEIHNAGDG